MSKDDVRSRRGGAKPPSDTAGDGPAEGAECDLPVYASVLQSIGLRESSVPDEASNAVKRDAPRQAPAGAKATARRFMTNGRPLRLLPGGRGADPLGRAVGSGPVSRPGWPTVDAGSRHRPHLLRPARIDAQPRPGEKPPAPWSGHHSAGPPPPWPDHPSWPGYLPGQLSSDTNQGGALGGRSQNSSPGPGPAFASAAGHAAAKVRAADGRHRRLGHCERPARSQLSLGELRALWAAQALSSAGDLIAQVAIAIAVYSQTRSPFLTALAYALTYLPPVLGAQLLPRLTADLPPRRLMITLDLARAGLVASMAMAGLPLAGFCALLFTVMVLGAPFSAARTALLQNLPPAARRPGDGLSSGAISFQASQAIGFLAGAAAVAVLQPSRVLLIDAATFGVSAALLAGFVRHRPAGPQAAAGPATPGTGVPGTGVPGTGAPGTGVPGTGAPGTGAPRPAVGAMLRNSPMLRTLLLLGWLAGFYVVPEGLAVPYAHSLGGGPLTVGLLMAAMPAGAVAGIIAFTRATRPKARMHLIGWLAMLCCMPLTFSSLRPPLWVVLILLIVAGTGTAYQLVVAAAVSWVVRADERPAGASAPAPPGARAAIQSGPAAGQQAPAAGQQAPGAARSGMLAAQSGLLAAQALGFVVAGVIAQLIGPQSAVALCGLLGLSAAAVLCKVWDRQHDRLVWARRAGAAIVRDWPGAY